MGNLTSALRDSVPASLWRSSQDNMNDDRRRSIEQALQRFRDTVEQHNFAMLHILVEGIETEPAPKIWRESMVKEKRINAFKRYLASDVRKYASSPRDLLSDDLHSELVSRYRLDGVSRRPNDLEKREGWFAAIRTGLAEMDIPTDHFPPADLQYLCSLVSGISGPGLPYWHIPNQFDLLKVLWGPWSKERLAEEKYRAQRRVEYESGANGILEDYWEDWEVTAIVDITGESHRTGGSFVLYCRNEEYPAWKWRYGAMSEDWSSDVYDSIEEYLDFYAHFNEPTVEDTRRGIRLQSDSY